MDDLISRQAVHEAIEKWAGSMSVLIALPTREIRPLLDSIHELPSAEKTGHWNFIGDQMFECSECKHIFTQRQLESWRTYTYESEFPNYCPNCGAKMKAESNIKQGLNYADEDTLMPAT